MEPLLFQTPGEALLASCVAAWTFYLIGFFLERPFISNRVAKRILTFVQLPKNRMEALLGGMHVRAVAGIHNAIQVTLALMALRNPALWGDTWHAVTPLSQLVLAISAGFFLWDSIISIRRASLDGMEFVMHGSLCFAFYLYVTLSMNFHFYGCGFLLWELSTPFVHLRWFLYKIGKGETKLYWVNGMTMMAVFCMCRIIWGGYLAMQFFISSTKPQDMIPPTTIWLLRGICVLLNGLNWYWFKQMIFIAVRLALGTHSGSKSTNLAADGKSANKTEMQAAQNGTKLKAT